MHMRTTGMLHRLVLHSSNQKTMDPAHPLSFLVKQSSATTPHALCSSLLRPPRPLARQHLASAVFTCRLSKSLLHNLGAVVVRLLPRRPLDVAPAPQMQHTTGLLPAHFPTMAHHECLRHSCWTHDRKQAAGSTTKQHDSRQAGRLGLTGGGGCQPAARCTYMQRECAPHPMEGRVLGAGCPASVASRAARMSAPAWWVRHTREGRNPSRYRHFPRARALHTWSHTSFWVATRGAPRCKETHLLKGSMRHGNGRAAALGAAAGRSSKGRRAYAPTSRCLTVPHLWGCGAGPAWGACCRTARGRSA